MTEEQYREQVFNAFNEWKYRQGNKSSAARRIVMTAPDTGYNTLWLQPRQWSDKECPCCSSAMRHHTDCMNEATRLGDLTRWESVKKQITEHICGVVHVAFQFGVRAEELQATIDCAKGLLRTDDLINPQKKIPKVADFAKVLGEAPKKSLDDAQHQYDAEWFNDAFDNWVDRNRRSMVVEFVPRSCPDHTTGEQIVTFDRCRSCVPGDRACPECTRNPFDIRCADATQAQALEEHLISVTHVAFIHGVDPDELQMVVDCAMGIMRTSNPRDLHYMEKVR